MDESVLEDRARKRLELEDTKQRRVALQLELEARRQAAEAAQVKLAELTGKPGILVSRSRTSDVHAGQPKLAEDSILDDDVDPDSSQSHAIIKERLAQRRREREAQHLEVSKKLDDLNARRWELQEEQVKLQQQKLSAAAQTAREIELAKATAREIEDALNINHHVTRQESDTAHHVEEKRGAQVVVSMQVLPPADLARRLGEAVPLQQKLITELQQQRQATIALAGQLPIQVPVLNPRMSAADIVSYESVAKHQSEWEESGAALNRRLRDEAFERAIRHHMKKIVDEVVLFIVADVAAEGSFANFWCAKQTAGSLIVDALLSHTHTHTASGAPVGGAADGLSSKQRLQKTNALIQILGDYRQRRVRKSVMHTHSIDPQPRAVKLKLPSKAEALQSADELLTSDKLLLYMDMPELSEEELKAAKTREHKHWQGIEAVPVFLTGMPEGVARMQPSPDSNMLAVSPTKSFGVTIYDIRHLPPRVSRKRAGWGARVVDMAWSSDSTQLVTLDTTSLVSIFSVRGDIHQAKTGILSDSGSQTCLNLVVRQLIQPLFDKTTKGLRALDLALLVDVREQLDYAGTAAVFHPCITLSGLQPSVMVGLQGGMLVKCNSPATDHAVYARCSVEPETADVGEGGGGGPVAPDSSTPLREYFLRHKQAVCLMAPVLLGEEYLSLDESGLVCTWKYEEKSFCAMGWFTPSRCVQVVVADAQFIEDQSAGKQTVFPNWFKGQGPDADKDKLEFAKASAEYAKTLDSEHNIDSTKPFEVRHWKEDSWAGRKKEGTLAIIKGQPIDSTTGLSFWHYLKYNAEGLLLSHTIVERYRELAKGFVLRGRIDYSTKRLVLLCYLPPARKHSHIISIFRVDLRDPMSLLPPRIDFLLPDATAKTLEALRKKAAAAPQEARNGSSERELQQAVQQALRDVDFDVAPPQGASGTHVAHVLLANKVFTISLDSGAELLPPLEPLAAQKRKGVLSCIRCVAKFDAQAGHARDPFAPLPEAHHDPDTPSSCEHLVICTGTEQRTAFMYSINLAARTSQQLAVSPASSRQPSRGGLDELVAQAALATAQQRSRTSAAAARSAAQQRDSAPQAAANTAATRRN